MNGEYFNLKPCYSTNFPKFFSSLSEEIEMLAEIYVDELVVLFNESDGGLVSCFESLISGQIDRQ